MLDTVLLESPPIDERTAAKIEARLKTRQGIDNATGELEYNIVSGSQEGSWQTSVAVNVKRQRFVGINAARSVVERPDRKGRISAALVECEPYVTIEGSVHKAIMGHNVYGGPLCPLAGSRWFVVDLARRLDVQLPETDAWEYGRLDWSEVYDLGCFEAVQEYIHAMRLADYSRRRPDTYGDETIAFKGTTTYTKLYHKGPEFSAHDFPRLARAVRQEVKSFGDLSLLEVKPALLDVAGLQELANRYLRVEVSIKSKKLKAEFGGKPSIVKVTREWLEALHDVETGRILQEGKSGMETVRKHYEVNARLREVYGHINGRPEILFGIWMQLSALGEQEVRKHIARRTFYRHCEQLREAGVSWAAADVCIRESASSIPAGFSLSRTSRFRLLDEAPEVSQALAPFRVAA